MVASVCSNLVTIYNLEVTVALANESDLVEYLYSTLYPHTHTYTETLMHPDSLFEGLVGVDSGCRLLCRKVGGGSKRGAKAHESLRLVMKDKFVCGIKINRPIFCFSFQVKHAVTG